MVPSFAYRLSAVLALVLAAGLPAAAGKAAKPIPLVAPEPKKDQALAPPPSKPASADPGKPGSAFAELNFNRTLVIEGKVEKPQVTFTLLKEPPPEKEIRFETSFLENILKLDRENTFVPGETYGHE